MTTTIGLVLFVKNDAMHLLDLFKSVINIIDSYCIYIFDSVDNTRELITDFFKTNSNICGIIRNISERELITDYDKIIRTTQQRSTYSLFVNSTSILKVDSNFDKNKLTHNVYRIAHHIDNYLEYEPILIRNDTHITFLGVNNFCIDYPHKETLNKLETLTLIDKCLGSSRQDKRKYEIQLIQREKILSPNKTYYNMYAGRCYQDLWKLTQNNLYLEKACKWYQRAVQNSIWNEELYCSHILLGVVLKLLNRDSEVMFHFLEAFTIFPKRVESLYELINYLRQKSSKHITIASKFYSIYSRLKNVDDYFLYIRHDVYDYLMDYEYSIMAYYNHQPIDHYRYLDMIGHCGQTRYNNVIGNYSFYVKYLNSLSHKRHFIEYPCGLTDQKLGESFHSTTPSIISTPQGYLINQPFVNYTMDKNGNYYYQKPIETINKMVCVDNGFGVKDYKYFKNDKKCRQMRYGVENLKLLYHNGEVIFNGIEYGQKMKKCVSNGVYSVGKDDLSLQSVTTNTTKLSHFSHDDQIVMITSLQPLTIKNSSFLDVIIDTNVPKFFSYLSNPTNGFHYQNQIWFVTQMTDYSICRKHYFCIVILDEKTLKYVSHSILFKFDNKTIENVNSLIVEPSRIIFSYSCFEADGCFYIIDRPYIDQLLFPNKCV